MYAQLGEIEFQRLKGFSELSDTSEASYAEHELIGGKPRLQRTGSALREVNITLQFHASFCNPTLQHRALEAYLESGETLPLLYGNGRFEGNFVLQSIGRTVTQADARGNFLALSCELVLKEVIGYNRLQSSKKRARAKAFAREANRPLPINTLTGLENPLLAVTNQATEAVQAQTQASKKATSITKVSDLKTDEIDRARTAGKRVQEEKDALGHFTEAVAKALDLLDQAAHAERQLLDALAPDFRGSIGRMAQQQLVLRYAVEQLEQVPPAITTIPEAALTNGIIETLKQANKGLERSADDLRTAMQPVAATLVLRK